MVWQKDPIERGNNKKKKKDMNERYMGFKKLVSTIKARGGARSPEAAAAQDLCMGGCQEELLPSSRCSAHLLSCERLNEFIREAQAEELRDAPQNSKRGRREVVLVDNMQLRGREELQPPGYLCGIHPPENVARVLRPAAALLPVLVKEGAVSGGG